MSVLPVRASEWARARDGLAPLVDRLLVIDADPLLQRADSDTAGTLRRTVDQLAVDVEELTQGLWALAAFAVTADHEVRRMYFELAGFAVALCDQAGGGGSADDLIGRLEQLRDAWTHLSAVRPRDSPSPLGEVLELKDDQVVDSRGDFSAVRVLSAYYLRWAELNRRLAGVLSPLTNQPIELTAMVRLAGSVLMSPHPVLTLEAAYRALAIIKKGRDVHPEVVVAALQRTLQRADRTDFSRGQILNLKSQYRGAVTTAEKAALTLDLYRKVLEGHYRHAIWAIHCITQHVDAETPMLAELQVRLRSAGGWLAILADAIIRPNARNAAAHEDYDWDGAAELLQIGPETIGLDELRSSTDLAESLVAGIDVGIELAIALDDSLASGVWSQELAKTPRRAARERIAFALFGTNGLSVQGFVHEAGNLDVHLETMPVSRINPCFQALTVSSRLLPDTRHFRVRIEGSPVPVISLDRATLDATYLVWQEAVKRFDVMPLSTFLPANYEARSAFESPMRAARAAAWIALDDALDAYNRLLPTPSAKELAWFGDRLSLVAGSTAAALTIVPAPTSTPLIIVHNLAESCALLVGAAQHSAMSGKQLSDLLDEMSTLHELWGPVARLPTVSTDFSGVPAE